MRQGTDPGTARAAIYTRIRVPPAAVANRQTKKHGRDAQCPPLGQRVRQRAYAAVLCSNDKVIADNDSGCSLHQPLWKCTECVTKRGLTSVLLTLHPGRLSRGLSDMPVLERRFCRRLGTSTEVLTQRTALGRRERAKQGDNLRVQLHSWNRGASVGLGLHWGLEHKQASVKVGVADLKHELSALAQPQRREPGVIEYAASVGAGLGVLGSADLWRLPRGMVRQMSADLCRLIVTDRQMVLQPGLVIVVHPLQTPALLQPHQGLVARHDVFPGDLASALHKQQRVDLLHQ